MPSLLDVADFTVSIGQKSLIKGLRLSVDSGEIVGLIGPSGSGKTTALRAIAGLIDSGGSVRLNGANPADLGWTKFRRQVTYQAQQPVLLDRTLEENLQRPFRYAASDGSYHRPTAIDLLVRLGLGEEHLSQEARSLSVGEQQRACLVRTLLLKPKVVLLDEPTSALDRDAVEQTETLITESVRANGLGVLIVTHEAEQLDRLCRRTVDLKEASP